MPSLPRPIAPKLRRELESTPEGVTELRALEARRRRKLDALYPEPDTSAIARWYDRQRGDAATATELVNRGREQRYLKDKLPMKWQRRLTDGRRFYTRLSNNEILRTVAIQCRNGYKVHVPNNGDTEDAIRRAQKQTRWLNALLPACERKRRKPLRRLLVDYQNGDGLGAWEIYLTGAYDELGLEEQREDESAAAYNRRFGQAIREAGMPFGIRPIDRLALFFQEDDEGVCRAMIVEDKPREDEIARLNARRVDEEDNPKPGTPGRPSSAVHTDSWGEMVETWRYYDRRWYAYFVEGQCVEGPVEHGLPGCPVILVEGIPTGSPNLSERYQGVTWGLLEIERALNDILTRNLDNAFRYQNPKVAITTPADGKLRYDDPDTQQRPSVVRFDDDAAPQLEPGQVPVNITQGWQSWDTTRLETIMLQLWERSGINPIAQGESPGSDPAGYTVNALQGAAQALYEVNLDNEARAWGEVCDFVRLLVRDTLNMPVSLAVPMGDDQQGGTEWLELSPDDIDETPAIVTIDPMGDAQRLSIRQSLMQGMEARLVPRREVQAQGYGADDPRAWDREIVLDEAKAGLLPLLIQMVQQEVMQMQAAANPLAAAGGEGVPAGPGVANGAMPAPLQPPTVGAQGGGSDSRGIAAAARGGQASSYQPPAGVMSP